MKHTWNRFNSFKYHWGKDFMLFVKCIKLRNWSNIKDDISKNFEQNVPIPFPRSCETLHAWFPVPEHRYRSVIVYMQSRSAIQYFRVMNFWDVPRVLISDPGIICRLFLIFEIRILYRWYDCHHYRWSLNGERTVMNYVWWLVCVNFFWYDLLMLKVLAVTLSIHCLKAWMK